ncbi:MAG: hypothetical protein K0S33_2545 [Bacteroidetes bacterium]|jgi:hypothetical protein|nr:hypothetical protein [Bacteroidota bacterium]
MKFVRFIILLILPLHAFSQLNDDLKDELLAKLNAKEAANLRIADHYFLSREYLMALPYYDTLSAANKDNMYLNYLVGVCYAYDAVNHKNSEAKIKSAEPIRDQLADYDYFLGKALLENEKYDEAIVHFEAYMKNPLDGELKAEVKHQILICKDAKLSDNKATLARITNIGQPVNTKGSEYSPVFPSDERFMVFTYRGEKSKGGKQSMPGKKDEKEGLYFEDVFISYKGPRGEWSEPMAIDAINTNGHDAAIFISQDGQRLFIYRNINAGNGDIYESHQDGNSWTKPEKVKGINSNAWEGSVCLSPDQKTIYFSSERPGGIGGRDIYFGQLMPDGSWGNVKNLGPDINTKFDEDAPFVHSDGKTLFFASTGHNTIGGYDIFRSEMKDGKWQKPFNVGKPINTPGDDKFYVVSSDGQRGYYSSEKSSGRGQQDIYITEPGMFGKPTAVVLLTGKVTYNEKPVDAEIKVISKVYKKDFSGLIKSNPITGDYLINLPSGNEFGLIFRYKDAHTIKDLSTALVDSFARLEINVDLMSADFEKDKFLKLDSMQIKSDDVSKIGLDYSDFVIKFGNKTVDSLTYTVQIGAYRIIENFNYASIIGLPKVERKLYRDGITRFTMGEFTTINEANELSVKAKKKGMKDAFVIAVYKDQRIFFNELMTSGILEK